MLFNILKLLQPFMMHRSIGRAEQRSISVAARNEATLSYYRSDDLG